MLEANSVTGSVKSVLEFVREAAVGYPDSPKMEISVITFNRKQKQESLIEAVQGAGASLDIVLERRRFDRQIIDQLGALIKARRPDIIWSHSVKSHFLVRFAGLNRSTKWVASHHGYTTTDLKMRLYNQLDRWSLPGAHRVLTVCRVFAKKLQSMGIPADHIHTQHMPIRPFESVKPAVTARLCETLGLTAETRVLLSVGRLSAEKGHANLVHAFRDFRRVNPRSDVRLVLVGDGPERGRLEGLCEDFKISRVVTLAGHKDDVRPYYSIADVFVLPSHSEGSPNVLLEAMSAGIPVIATTAGGIPELATNDIDALLVETKNIQALTVAISRMFGDAELRRRLGRSGKDVVFRHTPEAYFRSIASLFLEVLSDG